MIKGSQWIDWTPDLIEFYFQTLHSLIPQLNPSNRLNFKKILKYFKNNFFVQGTPFHVSQFNHAKQLMTNNDADCSTNCSESVNRRLIIEPANR